MPRLTPQELADRHLGMGATDVVEACGLAPWAGAGPMRLFCQKLGLKSENEEEDADPGREDAMEWGHVMEPVILDWYARTQGVQMLPGGHVPHPVEPWLWASLDASVIGASRIVEVKNVSSPALYRHWDVSSADGVPAYVRAQVTIGMACHGAREAHVVACVGGRPPHTWTVFYDAELADLLIQGAAAFWQWVQDGTPPPLDATPATRTYLLDKYPANRERRMVEAPAYLEDTAMRRIEAAQGEKERGALKRLHDAQLLEAIGDADGIEGNGWRMTWKLDRNGKRRPRFTGKGCDDE